MAKSFTLRDIPPDVFKILLTEQAKERSKNKGVFGLNRVVFKIIRDYERCRKEEDLNKSK